MTKELIDTPDPWADTRTRLMKLENKILCDLQEGEITQFTREELEDLWNFLNVFLPA